MTRTLVVLFLALPAGPALAQDYNRQEIVRGLCQPDGCDRALALDRLPFEEQVDGHDAAPPAVGVAEHRQPGDGLALGVDGRRLGFSLGPVRDEAPAQQVERALSGVVVLADCPQLLARGGCRS